MHIKVVFCDECVESAHKERSNLCVILLHVNADVHAD
jgi:hypothetical protein